MPAGGGDIVDAFLQQSSKGNLYGGMVIQSTHGGVPSNDVIMLFFKQEVVISHGVITHQTMRSPGTHLYIFSDEDTAAVLKNYGKVFRILKVLPMGGLGIRQAASEYLEAEVTARNIRMSSEQLRRKLGTRPGERYHIFGTEYLIVTEKMKFSREL